MYENPSYKKKTGIHLVISLNIYEMALALLKFVTMEKLTQCNKCGEFCHSVLTFLNYLEYFRCVSLVIFGLNPSKILPADDSNM